MKIWTSWKITGVVLTLSASCSPLQLFRGQETQHFIVHGDIPADRIEAIYGIFREGIFIPAAPEERIAVRIDRRLRRAKYEGKVHPGRISLSSYRDSVFIHELAHYLWEIRGWKLRPWLVKERARLKSGHPLIKEEFLNHYLIYDAIAPRVEGLLKDGARR